MITIQGKGVSAGVGVGPLYFYRRATAEIKRYTVEDTDAEWHRFKGAQTGAIEQLGVLAEQARKEAGDEAAMLFETHQMMAEDLDYEEAIEDRIVNQKMNAEAAVSDTSEQFAEMFASMDDAYMQARAADVKDVSQRILGILCGIVTTWPRPRRSSWTSPRSWASSRRAAPVRATRPFWPARWAFPPSSAWATRSSPSWKAAPPSRTAAPVRWSSTPTTTPVTAC